MILSDMKSQNDYKITTSSAEQTEQLGKSIGALLKGGEIIELASDLGGGKTTLARGIAVGLGVSDNITSPTFVISKVYSGKKLELHHYDFYRLEALGEMSDELREVIENDRNVTILEWAGNAEGLLPRERLIRIELLPLEDENSRELVIALPEKLGYVIKNLGAVKC